MGTDHLLLSPADPFAMTLIDPFVSSVTGIKGKIKDPTGRKLQAAV